MAENNNGGKHTIEDVLQKYAQSEEGGGAAGAQSPPCPQTGPSGRKTGGSTGIPRRDLSEGVPILRICFSASFPAKRTTASRRSLSELSSP